MFQTEHGPSLIDGVSLFKRSGGDEVNIVERGKNYGWAKISHKTKREGMETPIVEYSPAVAPASGMFYRGNAFPEFKGNFFFGGIKAEKASENNTKSNLKETESKVFEKLSFKEKRELETLETEIAAAEKRQIEIEKQLSLSASDAALVHELFSEQQNLNDKLDRDIERWAELSERVDL
jgi:glucose/arabinose dehydrogenase